MFRKNYCTSVYLTCYCAMLLKIFIERTIINTKWLWKKIHQLHSIESIGMIEFVICFVHHSLFHLIFIFHLTSIRHKCLCQRKSSILSSSTSVNLRVLRDIGNAHNIVSDAGWETCCEHRIEQQPTTNLRTNDSSRLNAMPRWH